MDWLLTYQNFG